MNKIIKEIEIKYEIKNININEITNKIKILNK